MSQLPKFTGPAGAAFQMSKPATLTRDFVHPEGQVVIREGAANVTVNLLNSHPVENVKSVAWRVIQETFDVLAANRQAALATSMGDSSCVVWFRNGDQYDLTCEATIESQWSFSARGTVGGAEPMPSSEPFARHSALRFYRMSQNAQGLFDAYRNAYLALECLISDVSPKEPGESELSWLIRVVEGPLEKAVPSGLDVKPTLTAIYRAGRNPLFHAKTGETFFPPHDAQREEVQALFERLALLLVSLLQSKFGREVVRRWATMSQSLHDTQTGNLLDFDEILFENRTRGFSVVPKTELIDSPRRFGQLWVRAVVTRPKGLRSMRKVQFLRNSKSWIQLELEESIRLSKVVGITFEISCVNRSLQSPRAFHPE